MIELHQVIPLLLEACPSFQIKWDDHCREYGDELPYVALGNFARHLLSLQQSGDKREFPAVAEVIERLHVDGSPDTREAATIGLLEGVQNVWSNCNIDPELFAAHLLPQSALWWRSLNDFWSGKSKFVGEGL